MAGQLRLRRGTTSQHNTFTGAEGEVTYDTNKKTIVVHDGVTVGGEALLNTLDATETVAGKAKIATTVIAQAGINDTDIMTPLKTKGITFGQGQLRKEITVISNTTYTNTTNKPIVVGVTFRSTASSANAMSYECTVNAIRTQAGVNYVVNINYYATLVAVILPGESYKFVAQINCSIDKAWEIS